MVSVDPEQWPNFERLAEARGYRVLGTAAVIWNAKEGYIFDISPEHTLCNHVPDQNKDAMNFVLRLSEIATEREIDAIRAAMAPRDVFEAATG